jgi:2-oxo-4-hydroxy-4-carboxy--5-ureidoimidazoline (OHCU) decarboxylase
VLTEAEARLANDPAIERGVALEQVCEVMTGRIQRLMHSLPPDVSTLAHPEVMP